jgi:hypothetical protein
MPELIDWILPHARRNHDVGLTHPLAEIVVRPGLEALHTGLSRFEARLHLVGRVREADRQLVFRRKHSPQTPLLPT